MTVRKLSTILASHIVMASVFLSIVSPQGMTAQSKGGDGLSSLDEQVVFKLKTPDGQEVEVRQWDGGVIKFGKSENAFSITPAVHADGRVELKLSRIRKASGVEVSDEAGGLEVSNNFASLDSLDPSFSIRVVRIERRPRSKNLVVKASTNMPQRPVNPFDPPDGTCCVSCGEVWVCGCSVSGPGCSNSCCYVSCC